MLTVTIPTTCPNEQLYALDVVLGEFLGLDFEVHTFAGEDMTINCKDSDKTLSLESSFFKLAHQHWLEATSMPRLPLQRWDPADECLRVDLIESSIPVLYGQPGLVKTTDHWHLSLDIFGSAFFMLSRYEEMVTEDRDQHDRFPATASVACKAGFLDRPIVNEYLEILWACMYELWPNLERKNRKFRKLVSCDVDHPIDHIAYSLRKTIFRLGARVLRDKNFSLAVVDGFNYLFKKFGSDRFDQYRNNIDWIMDVNEKEGNKVAFFFIPKKTSKNHDDANNITEPKMVSLLNHIVKKGHEIGFHPGYETYKFPESFKESADELKFVVKNLVKSDIGGRQHYLRYDVSITPQLWEENGFDYDSSLGYADKAGFRTGSCYEYSMYDLTGRRPLILKQRPLIVMDCTIISKGYEGLGISDAARDRVNYFEMICKRYHGDFTLLWHNSFFIDKKSKRFYLELIGE